MALSDEYKLTQEEFDYALGQDKFRDQFGGGRVGLNKWNELMAGREAAGLFDNADFRTGMSDRQAIAAVKEAYAKQNKINTAKQENQAARTSTEAAQSAAKNTQQAAQSTGIGGARAGVIANKQSAVNYGNQYLQNAPTMRGQASTAVADYLSKIGAARNAQQDANNAAAGAGWNMAGAMIEGAGKGATTGAVISDERCKEKPVEDNDILDAVNKYFDLVKQVKQLKEGKELK
jgi:hypothetical protein